MTNNTNSQSTGTNVEETDTQEVTQETWDSENQDNIQNEETQEQNTEEKQQKTKKNKNNVPQILSERNQLREQVKNLTDELEQMKQNWVSGDDKEYVDKLVEQRITEEKENMAKEREKEDFVKNYGDDKIDEIEKYVNDKWLSYKEASLLVRWQENINYSSETVVWNEHVNTKPKSIDEMSLEEAKQYLKQKEKDLNNSWF